MTRRPLTRRRGPAAPAPRVSLLVLPGGSTLHNRRQRPEAAAAGDGRNLTIEGLRGFSAAAVIAYHVHNMAIKGGYFHPDHGPLVQTLLKSLGRFGVLMFFMISGYLIAQSLVAHRSIRRFVAQRLWRIYPVFLPLHVIMFAVGPLVGYAWMGGLGHSPPQYTLQFFSNLLLLPGVLRLPIAQRNAWSLSYEFAFYAIACAFFFAAKRRVARGRRRLAFGAALGASVAMLVYHPIAAYFVIGVALFLTRDTANRLRAARRVPRSAGLLFLALAFVTYAHGRMLASLTVSVPFFFTVVHETGWLATFLRTRPLLALGRISYSLYLVHPFVLDPSRTAVRHLAPYLGSDALAMASFVALGVGGAIVTATALHRTVEVGVTRRLRHGATSREAGR
jgi:peptidoglycan/LPS O-acetylase OafA/YrhL